MRGATITVGQRLSGFYDFKVIEDIAVTEDREGGEFVLRAPELNPFFYVSKHPNRAIAYRNLREGIANQLAISAAVISDKDETGHIRNIHQKTYDSISKYVQ